MNSVCTHIKVLVEMQVWHTCLSILKIKPRYIYGASQNWKSMKGEWIDDIKVQNAISSCLHSLVPDTSN